MTRIVFWIFVLFLGGESGVCLRGYGQPPIAYYTFNNNARDESGNHNDGIVHGLIRAVMDRFGNPCGAYQFDGISGYIEVPSSATLERPAGAVTITAWYRFNSSRNNYWLTVLCKGIGTEERDDNPQYRLQIQQNLVAGNAACIGGPSNGSGTVSLKTGCTPCDTGFRNHAFAPFEWDFCAMVYDGQNMSVYINSGKVFEMPYTKPLAKNNSSLYIGLDEPGMTEHFDGTLDDVYIFDRALTPGEINLLYTKQRATSWDKEEYTISVPENKTVVLPSDGSTARVTFEKPVVGTSACGQVKLEQIAGPASGSVLGEGRYLLLWRASSETGYVQNAGYYLTVKPGVKKIRPVAPTPTPAPAPRVDTGGKTPYLPADLNKREAIVQKTIEVNSDSLVIELYDNGVYDGDTVSLFLNGRSIISKQEVTIKGQTFSFAIDTSRDNDLLMYAENLGSIPPNTALIVIKDGTEEFKVNLSSTLNENAVIRIRKRKK